MNPSRTVRLVIGVVLAAVLPAAPTAGVASTANPGGHRAEEREAAAGVR